MENSQYLCTYASHCMACSPAVPPNVPNICSWIELTGVRCATAEADGIVAAEAAPVATDARGVAGQKATPHVRLNPFRLPPELYGPLSLEDKRVMAAATRILTQV